MKAIEWLKATYGVESSEYPVRPAAFCTDGYSVSIQGGDSAKYCTPRRRCNIYLNCELGFPTAEDDLIIAYAENPNLPTDTVYAYVPIDTVEELIAQHGGIDFVKSISQHIYRYAASGSESPYAILLRSK